MKNLNFHNLRKNIKNNFLYILLASLLVFTASCRPERITIEEYKLLNMGSFRVETDYPYYYVVYRYGKMKMPATLMVRQQKVWEHNFTAETGDTLFLEVHTITSNVQGSRIKADIILNGKTVQTQQSANECVDGTCFAAKPLDLQMDVITN
jgi:hypothetical protein